MSTKTYGVVFYATHGGFHVPHNVRVAYNEQRVRNGREPRVLIGEKDGEYGGDFYAVESEWDEIDRADPDLVWAVSQPDAKASTNLHVAYMDARYDFYITEYDGLETVRKGKVKGCNCRCTCLDGDVKT